MSDLTSTSVMPRIQNVSVIIQGQHSIRINNQFRICFRWTAAGASNVEIVDYH